MPAETARAFKTDLGLCGSAGLMGAPAAGGSRGTFVVEGLAGVPESAPVKTLTVVSKKKRAEAEAAGAAAPLQSACARLGRALGVIFLHRPSLFLLLGSQDVKDRGQALSGRLSRGSAGRRREKGQDRRRRCVCSTDPRAGGCRGGMRREA